MQFELTLRLVGCYLPQMETKNSIAAGLNALATTSKTNSGPACAITVLLQKWADTENEKSLRAAIDNPEIQGSAIAAFLTESGFPVSAYVVRRHRRRGTGGGCACAK